jgi:hypothetical protein
MEGISRVLPPPWGFLPTASAVEIAVEIEAPHLAPVLMALRPGTAIEWFSPCKSLIIRRMRNINMQ